jgi:hypothetical protein
LQIFSPAFVAKRVYFPSYPLKLWGYIEGDRKATRDFFRFIWNLISQLDFHFLTVLRGSASISPSHKLQFVILNILSFFKLMLLEILSGNSIRLKLDTNSSFLWLQNY